MRQDIIKRAILGLIIGIALAGFGYADIEYIITPLPLEVNIAMINIGGLIALVAGGYLIYGLFKSPDTTYPKYVSPPPTYTSSIPPPPVPPTPARPQFCTHCGQPLSPDIKFCGNCGAPVS